MGSQLAKREKWEEDFLGFSGKEKEGTMQPHENALVVTVRIAGFDVKRVMIDQGSETKILYPDLYRGLGLTQANLSKYDTPFMAFDGSMVIPMGQIQLPVEIGGRKECVHFLVVHFYSPYTAILGHP